MLRCTPGICCQPSVRTPRASLWKPRILRAAYFPDPPLQPINIETRKAPMRRKGTKARGEHPAPGKCSVAIQAATAEAFQVAEHSRIAADDAQPARRWFLDGASHSNPRAILRIRSPARSWARRAPPLPPVRPLPRPKLRTAREL